MAVAVEEPVRTQTAAEPRVRTVYGEDTLPRL